MERLAVSVILTSAAFPSDVDECSEPTTDGRPPCGVGADCINLVGSFECACPEGSSGNPYTGCIANKVQCGRDSDCGQNEKCVQPGQCVCPPPYYSDTEDGNKCKSKYPSNRHSYAMLITS